MDPAYISAFAALAGSAIGGLGSFATSWLSHRTQARADYRQRDKTHRQELYRDFIEEASRLYADALSHDNTDPANVVGLYAKVGRLRILSSEAVIVSAERVIDAIVEAYLGPNRTLAELHHKVSLDPLNAFSAACRQELQSSGYL
jgi:hypothetical protein